MPALTKSPAKRKPGGAFYFAGNLPVADEHSATVDSVGQEQLTELDRRLHQSIHAIADNAVSQLFLPRIRSVLGLVFAGGSQDSAEQAKVAREAYRISAAGAATQPG